MDPELFFASRELQPRHTTELTPKSLPGYLRHLDQIQHETPEGLLAGELAIYLSAINLDSPPDPDDLDAQSLYGRALALGLDLYASQLSQVHLDLFGMQLQDAIKTYMRVASRKSTLVDQITVSENMEEAASIMEVAAEQREFSGRLSDLLGHNAYGHAVTMMCVGLIAKLVRQSEPIETDPRWAPAAGELSMTAGAFEPVRGRLHQHFTEHDSYRSISPEDTPLVIRQHLTRVISDFNTGETGIQEIARNALLELPSGTLYLVDSFVAGQQSLQRVPPGYRLVGVHDGFISMGIPAPDEARRANGKVPLQNFTHIRPDGLYMRLTDAEIVDADGATLASIDERKGSRVMLPLNYPLHGVKYRNF